MGGFSLWHWLVVLLIVVLVFGTKRLKNVGQDLGEAVRGFKKGLHEHDTPGSGDVSTPADAATTPTEGMRQADDERTPPAPR